MEAASKCTDTRNLSHITRSDDIYFIAGVSTATHELKEEKYVYYINSGKLFTHYLETNENRRKDKRKI
jgi:hypothetical protein